MHYTTQLGQDFLRKRQPPLRLAASKWANILLLNFIFKWKQLRFPERSKTEASFIWQIWHKSVALNAWRCHFNPAIDITCSICLTRAVEDNVHRFWHCRTSQDTWKYVALILNQIVVPTGNLSWNMFDWKQSIFAAWPPHRFSNIQRLWELLRGIML